jgi:F420-non-reducing hydrogenase small subunit
MFITFGKEPPVEKDSPGLPKFAVLQLSGCAGCEVSLLNTSEWYDKFRLVYMPLVVSTHHIPDDVEVLLVSGAVRNDEDAFNLQRAVRKVRRVIAVGTCAISGGVTNLGDRDDVRELFLSQYKRPHLPRLLSKTHPIDAFVKVDLYLPGCPPTPELFMAALQDPSDFKAPAIVCAECRRKKLTDMRPAHLTGFQHGDALPEICLINQGYLCVGTSTRGGCRAICTRPGHPCVGCRGPSNSLIEKGSEVWFENIQRVFEHMTDIPPEEVGEALRSPQLSMFLFQFSDYADQDRAPRNKDKIL